MIDFTFQNCTKIIFGKGTEKKVGEEILPFGKRVLLHYGGGSIKKTGLYSMIVNSLSDKGIECIELSGVVPNPRLSLVKIGIEICRKENIDLILAVGGGSVIDSAKAISSGVPYKGEVWDFYLGKSEIKEAIPIGVVLTIPAAGSESSTGSVITNEDGWLKRSSNSIYLRPKFAIMNPELTYTLPHYQTAAGITDMMAHIMERYFTKEKNVELTDRLCEATLKTIINNGPLALKNPKDYNSRAEIMWAGTVAHNDFLDTGRISDWGTHAIEHELSGIYDITHGAGLAVIFPAWMKYVYKENPDIFLKFATRVFGIEPDFDNLSGTIEKGIESLKQFFQSLGMPVSLKEAGIDETRFDEMAAKCVEGRKIGQFKRLTKEDVISIFKIAK